MIRFSITELNHAILYEWKKLFSTIVMDTVMDCGHTIKHTLDSCEINAAIFHVRAR